MNNPEPQKLAPKEGGSGHDRVLPFSAGTTTTNPRLQSDTLATVFYEPNGAPFSFRLEKNLYPQNRLFPTPRDKSETTDGRGKRWAHPCSKLGRKDRSGEITKKKKREQQKEMRFVGVYRVCRDVSLFCLIPVRPKTNDEKPMLGTT